MSVSYTSNASPGLQERWAGPGRHRLLRDEKHVPGKWQISTDAISESHKVLRRTRVDGLGGIGHSLAPTSLPDGKARMNASTPTDKARTGPHIAIDVNEKRRSTNAKSLSIRCAMPWAACQWPFIEPHLQRARVGEGKLAVVIARRGSR